MGIITLACSLPSPSRKQKWKLGTRLNGYSYIFNQVQFRNLSTFHIFFAKWGRYFPKDIQNIFPWYSSILEFWDFGYYKIPKFNFKLELVRKWKVTEGIFHFEFTFSRVWMSGFSSDRFLFISVTDSEISDVRICSMIDVRFWIWMKMFKLS